METTVVTRQRLTAAESEALWCAWTTNGDVEARDRLVLSYAPMVKYLAGRKIRELPSHCELEDLISCGLLALIGAVDRFDPAKGATFEQYAWTRVSGAIVDELRRQDWAPRSVRRMGREIERARESWLRRTGCAASEAELAGELGIEITQLRDRLEQLDNADLVSLNAPARGGEETPSAELGEMLAEPGNQHDPEAATLASERAALVRLAIAELTEREQMILGLVHVHHMQGAEVGRLLGLSESRVSQILSAIRCKIKAKVDAYDGVADRRAA